MAENLIRAGHELVLYNRSREKAAALSKLGASVADSIAVACRSEVVWTMLADDKALEDAALGESGLLASLAPEAPHVSSSTISVGFVRSVDAGACRPSPALCRGARVRSTRRRESGRLVHRRRRPSGRHSFGEPPF
ncbi:MAG: NAD(P)-binding domain-containing protein [Roseiarcus sp.]